MAGCSLLGAETPTTPDPGPPVGSIGVGDEALSVWVADDAEERRRGLMGVDRLPEGVDGMLFVFEEPGLRTFHMRGTPMELDIWWFDAGGEVVGTDEMDPCTEEPCPSYTSPGEVAWALETPRDVFAFPVGAALSTG